MSLPSSKEVPDSLVATRGSLHQLAYFVLSPARYRIDGRMGLEPAFDGFATPEFDGRVIRVEGDLIVVESDAGVASRTITTVADAAEFCGVSYQVDWFVGFKDNLEPVSPDASLSVDASAVRFIGDLFILGENVLRRFGEELSEATTEIQLWPEHFDLATEAGEQEMGRKASYGVSPGDATHPEPYFYVSAWGEIDRSNPFWNDEAFSGASLGYARLARSSDPERTALDFLVEGHRVIHTG